jgi:hypothetical protein
VRRLRYGQDSTRRKLVLFGMFGRAIRRNRKHGQNKLFQLFIGPVHGLFKANIVQTLPTWVCSTVAETDIMCSLCQRRIQRHHKCINLQTLRSKHLLHGYKQNHRMQFLCDRSHCRERKYFLHRLFGRAICRHHGHERRDLFQLFTGPLHEFIQQGGVRTMPTWVCSIVVWANVVCPMQSW